ncbi:MAG TPA: hypothetical protein DEP84_11260, partial [Chloroflexi bacterium]|nr:hypothetical protein [Chloroflexota bacterium]
MQGLVIALLLLGLMPPVGLYAAPLARMGPVRAMWIDLGMGQPLVDWFNQTARPDDIARVDTWEAGMLDQITAGRKLVVFKSVADAERLMPGLADRLDIIGYNLEHGPANAREDIADPVGSVQRMRQLADHYGKQLALGPDHQFAESDGVAMAPYVDMFILQVQRVQTDPAAVLNFVRPLVLELRRANPGLSVSVQVRTEGNVEAIVDLIDSLKESIDGVSILTSPETVDVAKSLVRELRTRADTSAPGTTASPAAAPPAPLATPVRAVPQPAPP